MLGIIEKYDRYFRYSSVLTFLLIAVQNFRLWAFPTQEDGQTILTQSTLMAFEFIMVHSALFMSFFAGSRWALLALIVFYGLFAVGFNLAMPDNSILYMYMLVVFNRMRFLLYEKDLDRRTNLIVYSAIATLIYFVLTVTFALSGGFIPELALTREFLISANYFTDLHSSGLFVEKPQVGLSLSIVYFSCLAYLEYRMIKFNGRLFVPTAQKA